MLAGTASLPVNQSTSAGDPWDWIKGSAVTLIIFFLGWGLKDVKRRYDQVLVLEKDLARLAQAVEDIQRQMDRPGGKS